MKETKIFKQVVCLIFISFFYHSLSALIGPVVPGQSLWCVNQRIASEVDNIESKLDNLCHAIMISEPGSITQEGAYCLGNEINGSITIAASNVDLDLSNHRITDGIIVNGNLDQITIENGTVEGGSDAISVAAGTHNVTIHDVTVKNGTRGISFQEVTDSVVTNCEMTFNTTGLELISSRNITVKNCVASANVRAGYSLISSTTNIFENCSAISTGHGNNDLINTTVFGFVTSNGFGNIFENCVANATQALTTTDQNSVVAGFALRGTEGCTKIIGCEAANATTSPTGVTVPIGILLESRFDGLTTVTSVNTGSLDDSVFATAWSPDGKYLVVTGDLALDDANTILYRFDRVTGGLVKLQQFGEEIDDVRAAAWSPNGLYLALGTEGDPSLVIYKFDNISERLTNINLVTGSVIKAFGSIDWSPDGRFLALGTVETTGDNHLFVVQFDSVTEALVGNVIAINPGGGTDDLIQGVNWSPDGLYLAVCGNINPDNDLFVYKFNRSLFTLTQVASTNPGGGTIVLTAAKWSPNGKYLATCGVNVGGGAQDLFIFRFDRATESLIEVDAVSPDGTGDQLGTLDWSPDGTYLAVGGSMAGTTGNDVSVFKFDQGTEKLTEIDSINPGEGSLADFILTIDWSPDGQYLAIGGNINADNDFFIYQALQFPENNIIVDNIVYCNAGATTLGGVGISGSSIANLIIGNTAYNEPTNLAITSNYQFVCNIFNSLFQNEPTTMQNVALTAHNPIPSRYDIPTAINRLELLAQSLIDNLL